MKLLLSGPPASGKSTAAWERFRAVPGSFLLTPTATMAEHVRHQLARSGFPVRPSRILTLAQWLDSPEIPKPIPRGLLHALVAESFEELKLTRFSAVSDFPGFHAAVADWMDEVPRDAALSGACGEDLARVFGTVEAALALRGLALRNTRLRAAAVRVRDESIAPPHVVLDGFFAFSDAELDLIEALAGRTEVTVTLPECLGAEPARGRLASAGFAIERLSEVRRSPHRATFSSATPHREAEEIARRILEYSGRKGRFRDIGIVLRARDPYGPLIETTLARFGIPVRAYFADPLAAHPAVAYIAGIVTAACDGWDHAELLALMRMPVTGVGATPAGDRDDFALRARLPGKGLPFAHLSSSPLRVDGRFHPAEWAARLRALSRTLPAPMVAGNASRDQIHAWRSTAAAVSAFEETLDQTAASFSASEKIPLAPYWKRVQAALALEPLRWEDRRRDVVHLMDVFEARQWELPVVFVCGLLEREFPQYHREDPLTGDAVRRRLGLTTAAQRQAEERFLFDLAVSRATEEAVLSYARFNEKGEESLPSFFLDVVAASPATPCEIRIRPKPTRAVAPLRPQPIQDAGLLRSLAKLHRKLSPSGIESFLQCPFQFFAGRTLRLKERPPAPRDRLDISVKGTLIHQALAEWIRSPLLGSQVLNRVFQDHCDQHLIPASYRTEAVRLELLRHFEAFLEESPFAPLLDQNPNWSKRIEESFHFALDTGVTIRGRIDRLEVGRERQALVIDYKYSPGNKVRERVAESEAGNLVQGGLYLLAAERALGLEPVGMLFCGLKNGVSLGGWHVSLAGWERIGEVRTAQGLRDLMTDAARIAAEAHDAIISGRLQVHPADRDKCRWCDYRHACRIDAVAAETEMVAAS